ncbi:MAG: hypothetical protein ACR2O6_02240 [Ilumatobacteraceae bacterium]
MTTSRRTIAAAEAGELAAGLSEGPVLQLVVADDPDSSAAVGPVDPAFDSTRRAIREQLDRHVGVARRLGIAPLTIDERASAMLDAACEGWRTNGRCIGEGGIELDTPHPTCRRAQYLHDVFLLEHGIITYERTRQ